MREPTKTTPLDVCASSRRARSSGETKHFLSFSVIACEPKGVSYPLSELTRDGIFCDHSDLLYEHNEMSPLMLLLIIRALFRKRKNTKQKIETNLCSCWMQNNKKHFDNTSFFFFPVNKPQTCWETVKKWKKKMLMRNMFVLTERTTTTMHAEIIWTCDLSLFLLFFRLGMIKYYCRKGHFRALTTSWLLMFHGSCTNNFPLKNAVFLIQTLISELKVFS